MSSSVTFARRLTAVPILEDMDSLFVPQLPVAGQIKAVCIENLSSNGKLRDKALSKRELLENQSYY